MIENIRIEPVVHYNVRCEWCGLGASKVIKGDNIATYICIVCEKSMLQALADDLYK